MPRSLTNLALLCCVANLMSAEPVHFRSSTNRTLLLELYTSEGCSSCPPAEKWFSHLKTNSKLWKDFVPLAFHVDYWDYLGWRDPFGAATYSDRQRAYAAAWQRQSVYTPGFVLDGKEWRDWHNRNEPPRASNQAVGTLTASSEDRKQWVLRFEPATPGTLSTFDFHAALLGFDLSSEVKAGENRGRNLQHDFVVLATAKSASNRSIDAFRGAVSLVPASRVAAKRLAVAAWVTPSSGLKPLQAVGGWLPLSDRYQ